MIGSILDLRQLQTLWMSRDRSLPRHWLFTQPAVSYQIRPERPADREQQAQRGHPPVYNGTKVTVTLKRYMWSRTWCSG